MTDDARAIAEQLTADLFVNGAGQQAERLVLASREGRDLGGWGREVVRGRIAAALSAAREAGRQQGLDALKAAVALIREWHGMGMGVYEAEAWALYQGSPEMKPILAALAEGEHE